MYYHDPKFLYPLVRKLKTAVEIKERGWEKYLFDGRKMRRSSCRREIISILSVASSSPLSSISLQRGGKETLDHDSTVDAILHNCFTELVFCGLTCFPFGSIICEHCQHYGRKWK